MCSSWHSLKLIKNIICLSPFTAVYDFFPDYGPTREAGRGVTLAFLISPCIQVLIWQFVFLNCGMFTVTKEKLQEASSTK